MEKVFPQTLSESADATIIAVVNRLLWIIIPKLANGAVVASSLISARVASLRCSLRSVAQHAQHVFGLCSWKWMVFHVIVTKSASIPTPARAALHFDVAFVVFTAKLQSPAFKKPVFCIHFRRIWWRVRRKKILLGEIMVFGLLLEGISGR